MLQRSGASLLVGTAAVLTPPVQGAPDTHIPAINRTLSDNLLSVHVSGIVAVLGAAPFASEKIVNVQVLPKQEAEAMKVDRLPAEFMPMAVLSLVAFSITALAVVMTFFTSVAVAGQNVGIGAMFVACLTGARAASLVQSKRH